MKYILCVLQIMHTNHGVFYVFLTRNSAVKHDYKKKNVMATTKECAID